MTLLPVEQARLASVPAGLHLPDYTWRGPCLVPGCDEPATDPHHIVRRTAGGRYWIMLDGTPVPNVAGICRRHHDQVTDHRARMAWDDEAAWWLWLGPDATGHLARIRAAETPIDGRRGCCPTCGRTWPKPRPWAKAPRREREVVGISVPADSENGREIMETLLAEAARLQGFDDAETPALRYYALTGALAAFIGSTDDRATHAELRKLRLQVAEMEADRKGT